MIFVRPRLIPARWAAAMSSQVAAARQAGTNCEHVMAKKRSAARTSKLHKSASPADGWRDLAILACEEIERLIDENERLREQANAPQKTKPRESDLTFVISASEALFEYGIQRNVADWFMNFAYQRSPKPYDYGGATFDTFGKYRKRFREENRIRKYESEKLVPEQVLRTLKTHQKAIAKILNECLRKRSPTLPTFEEALRQL